MAEPGSLIAFAGAAGIIQGYSHEKNYLLDFSEVSTCRQSGFVDLIVERKDLREKIGTLLSILLKKNSAIKTVENETTESNTALTKAS